MSAPLRWPRKLAELPYFPAALVEPLAAHGIVTVGDLVARIKRSNPGLTPPSSCYYMHLRLNSYPLTDEAPELCSRGMSALVAWLDYGEWHAPHDWTDPPNSKKPTPEPIMPAPRELPTASLTLHEEHSRVPMMSAKLYKVFAADIKANGVKEPIKLIPGTRIVIDGRTRLQAAIDAGLPSVPVEDADLGEFSPVMYMMRVAHLRRSLNPGQAIKLGNEIKKQLRDEMRLKKKEGGKKGGQKSAEARAGKTDGKLAAEVPQASAEKKTRAPGAREQAAAMTGASPKAIDTAGLIEKKAPEVYAKLGTDEIPTLAAAKKAAGIEEPKKKDKPLKLPLSPTAPKLGKPLKEIAGFPAKLAATADDRWISTDIDLNKLIERDPDQKWKGKNHRERVLLALTSISDADPAECEAGTDAFMDYLYPGRKKDQPAAKPAVVHCPGCKATYDATGKTKCPSCGRATAAEPTSAEKLCATLHELKPCPFCGCGERVGILGKSCVTCHECGSTGPVRSSEEAAVAAWNKRAEKKEARS